jgi:hypothetical protein
MDDAHGRPEWIGWGELTVALSGYPPGLMAEMYLIADQNPLSLMRWANIRGFGVASVPSSGLDRLTDGSRWVAEIDHRSLPTLGSNLFPCRSDCESS